MNLWCWSKLLLNSLRKIFFHDLRNYVFLANPGQNQRSVCFFFGSSNKAKHVLNVKIFHGNWPSITAKGLFHHLLYVVNFLSTKKNSCLYRKYSPINVIEIKFEFSYIKTEWILMMMRLIKGDLEILFGERRIRIAK